MRAVAGFSKPLLAGVTGSCIGLGVSLLPLCDLVYVTEKAALQLPYAALGTVPEGGATHSLTALLGHAKVGPRVAEARQDGSGGGGGTPRWVTGVSGDRSELGGRRAAVSWCF